MGGRTSRVLLNALSNYVRFGVSMLILIVLTPRIISGVGEADYGLWTLVFSVLGIIGLADFGFGTAVVKFVAECKGSGDIERRNRILSTLFVVYALISVATMGTVGGLTLFFNSFFTIPETQHGRALALLWILAARSLLVALPLSLFRGLLFGEQRIVLINVVQVFSTLIYGLGSLWALTRGMGIVTLAWFNFAAALFEHALYVLLAYRTVEKLHLAASLARRDLLKETLTFSASQLIVNVSNLVLLRTDPILVKLFLPLPAVAVYAIALRIAESIHLLTKQFINVLAPVVAEMKGRGEEEAIRYVLVGGAKFSFAPAVLLAAAIYAFGRETIVIWVGPEFEGAVPVLFILITAMTLAIPQIVASTVLAMTGHHHFSARAALAGTALNVVSSAAMAPFWGLTGIALGTLLTAVVVDLGTVVRVACRLHRVRLLRYAQKVFLPAIVPGVAQYALSVGLKQMFPPASLIAIAILAIPGAVFYGIAFYFMAMEPGEKQLVSGKLFPRSGRKA